MATKVEKQKLAAEDWRVGLSDEQLRDLLYMLKLCRYFDERMEALYRQGRLPGRDLLRSRPGGHARRGDRRAAQRTTRCSRRTATCRRSSPRVWT